MTSLHAREGARELLAIIPLVMRAVAAELRAGGELPAPAHFGLLMTLSEEPRTLTELAAYCGVSLPTMSKSVSTLAERGWVRRSASINDRRRVKLEVTIRGRAALTRVDRAAVARLAEVLAPLDATSRQRLHAGLDVLRTVFATPALAGGGHRRRSLRARN